MFIKATQDFKPGDPATHVNFITTEKLGSQKVLIILTPDGELVPYSAEDHNDATQANGIREGFTIGSMAYKTYCNKTLDQRNLKKASLDPTKEEIDSFFSLSEISAYVAEGFDPIKGDANTTWGSKAGHTKKTEILVLKEKFFGVGYEPYKPSQHGENKNVYKPITVNNYRVTRLRVRAKCDKWLKNNNKPIIAPMLPVTPNPTQAEIDIFLSPVIDAYVAEGFDFSKGDANEKYDSCIHGDYDKILVLKNKIFGGGYVPYKPSEHSEYSDEFKSVTVSNYRSTRSAARKAYKGWLVKNNITDSNIDTTPTTLFPRSPTQREIDIFTSKKINAYVTAGFDPSKGDNNEKYTSKLCRADEILVLKKKLFGGGYEPYIPSQHGTNQNDFKSVTVGYFYTARNRSRKAYALWKNANSSSASATTSTTTTSTSSDREVVDARALTFLDTVDSNPKTLFSTQTAISLPSNQETGPKRFNPIILIGDSEQISETREHETDNCVPASQTCSTSQQRKRVAEDSVLNSTLSFTGSSFSLFQGNVPTVPQDPKQPKRFRPWE